MVHLIRHLRIRGSVRWKKTGVIPIISSCWSDSGEAVCGVFVHFVVLWDGTGLNNRMGIDKMVSSCGNTGVVRFVVFRSDINDGTGISMLAQ